MNPDVLNQNDCSNTPSKKHPDFHAVFYINSPCIFCERKIVRAKTNYDLVEFIAGGGIVLRDVMFRTATLMDDVLDIEVYDIDANRILHRSQQFRDKTVPCDWVLVEKNYFNADLLEFDFD